MALGHVLGEDQTHSPRSTASNAERAAAVIAVVRLSDEKRGVVHRAHHNPIRFQTAIHSYDGHPRLEGVKRIRPADIAGLGRGNGTVEDSGKVRGTGTIENLVLFLALNVQSKLLIDKGSRSSHIVENF